MIQTLVSKHEFVNKSNTIVSSFDSLNSIFIENQRSKLTLHLIQEATGQFLLLLLLLVRELRMGKNKVYYTVKYSLRILDLQEMVDRSLELTK